MTGYKGYRYRIYPNTEQKEQFAKTFGCCRFVYNRLLALQQERYAKGEKHLSKIDANNYCVRVLKNEFPWLREVDKFALTNSIFALEEGYSRFFRKQGGHPKFKSKKTARRKYTTNITGSNIAITEGGIKLPKAGVVKAKLHRQLPKGAEIKGATVEQTASGKYYCSILVALPEAPVEKTVLQEDAVLGLDYSSPSFYVDSNGSVANPPHWLRESEKRLKKLQRRLSKKKKGSKNRERARRKVAILHEKIANQRKDFCHQQSAVIAKQCDAVCVEDINLRGMAASLRLGKSTNDNGFGMFRTFLEYKLREQGKQLAVIDKWFPSSQLCSECGALWAGTKDLGTRHWICPNCGAEHDRDVNAARNIKTEGIRLLRDNGYVVA